MVPHLKPPQQDTSNGESQHMLYGINNSKTRAQGPVVQSIVSLTSSLRGQFVKCFTTL